VSSVIPSSSDSLLEAAVGAGFFENLPERCVASRGNAAGEARMREPVRDQIELRAADLDSLIGADHSARLFWDYVQKLDLSAVEGATSGVERVLELLRTETSAMMQQVGAPSIKQLVPAMVRRA
jgi:hypothetical protein